MPKLKALVGQAKRVLSSSSEVNIYDDPPGTTDDNHLRDTKLHAKIIAVDLKSGKGAIWLGSANWTSAGLGINRPGEENFELMVRVQLPKAASKWLGSLDVDDILEEETQKPDDGEEADEDKAREVNERWLVRLKPSWAAYPHTLNVSLVTRPSEKKSCKKLFKWLEFSVEQTMSEASSDDVDPVPQRFIIGRCKWQDLLQKGTAGSRSEQQLAAVTCDWTAAQESLTAE